MLEASFTHWIIARITANVGEAVRALEPPTLPARNANLSANLSLAKRRGW